MSYPEDYSLPAPTASRTRSKRSLPGVDRTREELRELDITALAEVVEQQRARALKRMKLRDGFELKRRNACPIRRSVRPSSPVPALPIQEEPASPAPVAPASPAPEAPHRPYPSVNRDLFPMAVLRNMSVVNGKVDKINERVTTLAEGLHGACDAAKAGIDELATLNRRLKDLDDKFEALGALTVKTLGIVKHTHTALVKGPIPMKEFIAELFSADDELL